MHIVTIIMGIETKVRPIVRIRYYTNEDLSNAQKDEHGYLLLPVIEFAELKMRDGTRKIVYVAGRAQSAKGNLKLICSSDIVMHNGDLTIKLPHIQIDSDDSRRFPYVDQVLDYRIL